MNDPNIATIESDVNQNVEAEDVSIYVCSICNAVFKSNKAVAQHMVSNHTTEIHIHSSINVNRFTQQQNINTKVRRYSKIHECTECSYKTVHQTSFKRHLLTHQKGYKRKKCPYCSYSAIQMPNLKRHILGQHIN